MEEYKLVNKYLNKNINNKKSNNQIIRYINKFLILILISVSLLCLSKNEKVNTFIKDNVFSKNILFSKINAWYNKTFGNIYPIENINPEIKEVFNETLSYSSKESYKEGVKLKVANNYVMPVLESGIVVFKGNKDNYGYTTIIQQVDGVDIWYVGIDTSNLKLYDYVEKGSILGESSSDTIYLYYQKDGKFIDYKKYIG